VIIGNRCICSDFSFLFFLWLLNFTPKSNRILDGFLQGEKPYFNLQKSILKSQNPYNSIKIKKKQTCKLSGNKISRHSRNNGNHRTVMGINLKLLDVVIPRYWYRFWHYFFYLFDSHMAFVMVLLFCRSNIAFE